MTPEKKLTDVSGQDLVTQEAIHGYEMHIGRTEGPDQQQRPRLNLAGHNDGAVSICGKVSGCYLHGLFSSDSFRSSFLRQLGRRHREGLSYEQQVETTLDLLATLLEEHMDLDTLLNLAKESQAC